jgi:carboxyl-terminal processing protease
VKSYRLFSGIGALWLIWFIGFCLPAWALEESGGVGMTVAQLYDETAQGNRGYIVVLDVFKDGPAESAGVESGDIITHINGRITKEKDLKNILQAEIRGPEGQEVTLRIWRYSQKKRIEIKVIRTQIFY